MVLSCSHGKAQLADWLKAESLTAGLFAAALLRGENPLGQGLFVEVTKVRGRVTQLVSRKLTREVKPPYPFPPPPRIHCLRWSLKTCMQEPTCNCEIMHFAAPAPRLPLNKELNCIG